MRIWLKIADCSDDRIWKGHLGAPTLRMEARLKFQRRRQTVMGTQMARQMTPALLLACHFMLVLSPHPVGAQSPSTDSTPRSTDIQNSNESLAELRPSAVRPAPDAPILAGWDDGFFLRSVDKHFNLRITGQIQEAIRCALRPVRPRRMGIGRPPVASARGGCRLRAWSRPPGRSQPLRLRGHRADAGL